VRDHVDKGHDAETLGQLFDAMTHEKIPLGMTIIQCHIEFGKSTKKAEIKDITMFNDFEFLADGSIKMWRHYGIGQGKTVKNSVLKDMVNVADIVLERLESPTNNGRNFWATIGHVQQQTLHHEEPSDLNSEEYDTESTVQPNENDDNKIYECPEDGCISAFMRYGNLQRHLAEGKHKRVPIKINTRDYALGLYSQRLEGFDTSNTLKGVNDDVFEEVESTDDGVKKEGWGLKAKRVSTRHSEAAKEFIEELFKQGKEAKKKIDPKEAHKLMKEEANKANGKLKREDILTWKQISARYSLLARKERENKDAREKRSIDSAETDGNIEDELFDEEEFDYLDDPIFESDFEELRDAIFSSPDLVNILPENQ
jgi:hypothetical protein